VSVAIKIVALAGGGRSGLEGEFVREYHPGRMDEHGNIQGGRLRCTQNIAEALHFADAGAALECWRQSRGFRPDGKPNRPLTAWTVEIQTVPE
jgi:hypothetical protein